MVERQHFCSTAIGTRHARADTTPVGDVHIGAAVIGLVTGSQSRDCQNLAVDRARGGGGGAAQKVVAGLACAIGQGEARHIDHNAFARIGTCIGCRTCDAQTLARYHTRQGGCT